MRGQFALVIKNDDKNLNNIGKVVMSDKSGTFLRFGNSEAFCYFSNEVILLEKSFSEEQVKEFADLVNVLNEEVTINSQEQIKEKKEALSQITKMKEEQPTSCYALEEYYSINLRKILTKTKKELIQHSFSEKELSSFKKLVNTLSSPNDFSNHEIVTKKAIALGEITKLYNEDLLKLEVLLSLHSLSLSWYENILPNSMRGSLSYKVKKTKKEGYSFKQYELMEIQFCCDDLKECFDDNEEYKDCSTAFRFDTSDGDLTLENTIVGGGYHIDLYSQKYELKFCPFCGSKGEKIVIS